MDLVPIPMILFCPACHERHIDRGEWAMQRRHKTHECEHCGFQWRPANVPTVGVENLSASAGLFKQAFGVWHPIATAPKDKPVLACCGGFPRVMHWREQEGHENDGGFGPYPTPDSGRVTIDAEQPLYWMPLPPLPKS